MSEPMQQVRLSPEAEAERLWRGAREAFAQASQSVVHLCESLELGVRVVEIMTSQRLQSVRHEFPGSIATLLAPPPPDVDPQRDFLHPPKALRFIDALDMLSGTNLPCISPQLHHGWEDRALSCRRSRARTNKATGIALNQQQRDALILIGAYRNRIFLLPPPVRIVPEEVLGAFPTLIELVEQLFGSGKAATD